MARSSDRPAARGFVPPQNDAERMLMRHAEDLAGAARAGGYSRYSAFLSDREQALCRAAMNRCGCQEYRFWGGYEAAERCVLCVEPGGAPAAPPVACVKILCRLSPGAAGPRHPDYLGSLMGLSIRREGLGDLILPPGEPGVAYAFALEPVARLICEELCEVGRASASAQLLEPEAWPELAPPERQSCTATVSSLRLDAVLAAMLHCSRGQAAELIAAGRVEINHLPATSPGASVYVQDVFTVRGKGRFALTALPGKSKKDRQIITYLRY